MKFKKKSEKTDVQFGKNLSTEKHFNSKSKQHSLSPSKSQSKTDLLSSKKTQNKTDSLSPSKTPKSKQHSLSPSKSQSKTDLLSPKKTQNKTDLLSPSKTSKTTKSKQHSLSPSKTSKTPKSKQHSHSPLKRSPFRLIMGKNCIKEVLRASPERLVEVYTSQNEDELLTQLIEHKIPIRHLSKEELTRMVDSDSHQSYIASIKERSSQTVKEFLDDSFDKEKSFVVMLDSICDPQNLGAILRAAECFAIDLVMFSKNRGTDITPVVTKASVGASESVPIIKVSNLAETAKLFQDAGYAVLAAEARENSISLNTFTFPKKSLLILGSEGEGIQPLLSKNSDTHLMIPMLGKIDSLNVSQAASIFFYAALSART